MLFSLGRNLFKYRFKLDCKIVQKKKKQTYLTYPLRNKCFVCEWNEANHSRLSRWSKINTTQVSYLQLKKTPISDSGIVNTDICIRTPQSFQHMWQPLEYSCYHVYVTKKDLTPPTYLSRRTTRLSKSSKSIIHLISITLSHKGEAYKHINCI